MNNGGPAFPIPSVNDGERVLFPCAPGMSLRDYFAAAALPAVIELTSHQEDFDWANAAKGSYAIADAMLAARAAAPVIENRKSPIGNCEDTSTHD